MRNFLTIFIIAVFVVFVLIVLPTSLTGGKNVVAVEKGRVLGASEAMADEHLEKFFKNYSSLPKNLEINPEKKILKVPYKKDNCEDIDIGGMLGIVVDMETNKILFEKKADIQASIASITKLMTALTFLEFDPSWNSFVEIKREDLVDGAQIYISQGDKIEIKDLFNLSLIASANSATKALVHSTGISEFEFVKRMNQKAESMGLLKTEFVDPIGFSYMNLSTPKDISVMLKEALQNDFIVEVMQKSIYSFKTREGRLVSVKSTNKLLGDYLNDEIDVLGGKTGYTSSAGYCFTGGFENQDGHKLLSVVLGGTSYDSRFFYTDKIVKWAYKSYKWR